MFRIGAELVGNELLLGGNKGVIRVYQVAMKLLFCIKSIVLQLVSNIVFKGYFNALLQSG